LGCAIEDAGWEIRDQISWVHTQGFPKSLDVSKAIDKLDAVKSQNDRRLRFTQWVRSTGVTSAQIDDATGSQMGGHYTTAQSQPAIMTREHLEACRHLFAEVPSWVEEECDRRSVESENMKRRRVVGETRTLGRHQYFEGERYGGPGEFYEHAETEAHTPEAREWQGWGTALKPAVEPIVMARKPLTGTVAANVLEHGAGAINVDGCRVASADTIRVPQSDPSKRSGKVGRDIGITKNDKSKFQDSQRKSVEKANRLGRWPANLIHDDSDDVREALGDARRVFYVAKPTSAERDAGLGGDRNTHTTVKPIKLMQYLCRMVARPGAMVLDPFCGSGTTGCAAVREGMDFIGFELDEGAADQARRRVKHAATAPVFVPDREEHPDQLDLFGDAS
jgi:hypothetical protein